MERPASPGTRPRVGRGRRRGDGGRVEAARTARVSFRGPGEGRRHGTCWSSANPMRRASGSRAISSSASSYPAVKCSASAHGFGRRRDWTAFYGQEQPMANTAGAIQEGGSPGRPSTRPRLARRGGGHDGASGRRIAVLVCRPRGCAQLGSVSACRYAALPSVRSRGSPGGNPARQVPIVVAGRYGFAAVPRAMQTHPGGSHRARTTQLVRSGRAARRAGRSREREAPPSGRGSGGRARHTRGRARLVRRIELSPGPRVARDSSLRRRRGTTAADATAPPGATIRA